VRIRYVELPSPLLRAKAGERLSIPISTDVRRLQYALRRGTSVVASGASGPRVTLRAPATPGRYVLVVDAGRHRARAVVLVRKR
jgi:hypothetical protein